MRTNLYRIVSLPPKVWSVGCNLSFGDALQFLKDKPVIFYAKSRRLYFFGDRETIRSALDGKQSDDFREHDLTPEFVHQNWHVISVLLYKGLRSYLWERGFLFHGRKGTRAYMVKHRAFGENPPTPLVYNYSDGSAKAYVHEGFTFLLKRYRGEVYLLLDPCLVITNGLEYVGQGGLSQRKQSEYKLNFVDRRYNRKVRSMVDVFVDIMTNGRPLIEIQLYGQVLMIDPSPVRIED